MYNGPERKAQRLKEYDYSSNGGYFVTICTKDREKLFGEIINGEMVLNDYGKIVKKCWFEIKKHYENVLIDEFVIMPNHIHGIIFINVGNEYFRSDDNGIVGNEYFRSDKIQKTNISNVIKGFKIGITKEIRNLFNDFIFGFQKSFYERIIRNEKELDKIRQYIIENPIKWEFDKNNEENI